MMAETKTIFIIITRSFITRNILRSGALELLKKDGYRIVIFFHANSIPAYIKEEFEDDQVILVDIHPILGKIHRRFTIIGKYLLFTDTTKLLACFRESRAKRQEYKDLPKRSNLIINVRLLLLKLLSKINIAKRIFRAVDFYIFSEKNEKIKKYFNQYNPVLVFSTSIISTLDIAFMKEARQRGIKTASMQKGWDNLLNGYYRFAPDYFLVPNKISVDLGIKYQGLKRDNIYVIGMPQFDWYRKDGIIRSRADHFLNKGLDPNRALIFFGSEGIWATFDHQIAEKIYEWIINNELIRPCQLLARSHYSNVLSDVFKNLRGKEHVVVDNYRITNFLIDSWDPSISETIDFTNSIYHCDIMVNAASTLSLDAAATGRPVINILFGCSYRDGKDITIPSLYGTDHYKWVLDLEATALVYNFNQLKDKINDYLLHPEHQKNEREQLVKKLCYKVDGQSSLRLADSIKKIIDE